MSEKKSASPNKNTTTAKPHKLLISGQFFNKSSKFRKHEFVVQGEPFSWGVTIKNIDNKPSPEAIITNAGIKDLNNRYFQYMEEDSKYVKSLNPDEEIFIEIDKTTVFLEGVQWCYVDIKPKESSNYFLTYQLDSNHNRVIRYSEDEDDHNKWMDHMYIQKKMELLQSKTNHYILVLTFITVWESLFGIKETMKNLATFFAWIFSLASDGVAWIAELL